MQFFLDSGIPPALDGLVGFWYSKITVTLTLTKDGWQVKKLIGGQWVDVDAQTINTGAYVKGTLSVADVQRVVSFELIKSLGRKALFLIGDLTADGADQDAVMVKVHDFIDRIVPAVLDGDSSVIDW